MRTTLITGGLGQLGLELAKTSPSDGQAIALSSRDLDITNRAQIQSVLDSLRPSTVINTAAITGVDDSEDRPESAFAVNRDGVARLAEETAARRIRLIHISTDYVFNGRHFRPYRVEDLTEPESVYGASKRAGELIALSAADPSSAVIRTAWLYSSHGTNFVLTILRRMANGGELRVVADQTGSPTWAGSLARAIWCVAGDSSVRGLHHWTDAGSATWYDFAVAVAEEALVLGYLRTLPSIVPIRTEDYLTKAKRPAYSVLDSTKTWAALHAVPLHWRQSLRLMLQEYKESVSA